MGHKKDTSGIASPAHEQAGVSARVAAYLDPDRVTTRGVKVKLSRRVNTLKTMNVGVAKAEQKTAIKKNVQKTLAAENGVHGWLVHFCDAICREKGAGCTEGFSGAIRTN